MKPATCQKEITKQLGIYQRGQYYWIRYTCNKRQIKEPTGSKKLKDAQDLLKIRQAEVVKGELEKISRIKNSSFFELATDYLNHSKHQKDYNNKLSIVNMLKKEFGDILLNSFTIKQIENYQTVLRDDEQSETTVNRKVAVLKHMFTKAADWSMTTEEMSKLVHRVKMFKLENERHRFLSEEEIQRLYTACDYVRHFKNGKTEEPKQKHLKPIINFALNTGCRKEEILSLKWKQVDLTHGFINLDKTKNGEKRHIDINKTLNKLLTELKEKNPEGCQWVFIDEKSKKRLIDISHSFITAKKRAGIEDFHFHDLRHTFASQLVLGGADIYTVSKLLGHKSLKMTMRYAHFDRKHFTNAVNTLNDIMQPKAQN